MTPAEFGASGLWTSNHFSIATYAPLAILPDENADATYTEANGYYFNPTNLDFDGYLSYARNLGATGAILTSKHTGGLTLWPSEVDLSGSRSTIADTSWYANNGQRDVLLEWVTKARSYGLKVGLYFCVWDSYLESLYSDTPASVGSTIYTQWTKDQLTEILTQYGEIDFLILDGWGNTWPLIGGVPFTIVPYQEIYDHVKDLQSGCVVAVNDHEDGSETTLHGDVSLWERNIDGEPAAGDITNFEAGALWSQTQRRASNDAEIISWHRHVDSDTMVAADAVWPISRGFRMANLSDPPVVHIMNYSSNPDGTLGSDTALMLDEILERANTRVAYDPFALTTTEAAGITLASHASVDGTTWTKTFGTAGQINPYGILRGSDASGAVYTNSATVTANHRTVVTFKVATVPSSFSVAAFARANGASTQDYRMSAAYSGGVFTMSLAKNNSGLTVFSTATAAVGDNPAVGKLYKVICEANGTAIRGELWIDNTGTGDHFHRWTKLFATDSAISAANKAGLYWAGATTSNTTGAQIVSFESLNVDATAPDAPVLLEAGAREAGVALAW